MFVFRDGDGNETDVTEAVKVMYDCVHAGTDWGSGFLDNEEYALLFAVADLAGFDLPGEPYESSYRRGRAADIREKTKEIRAMFADVPKRRR